MPTIVKTIQGAQEKGCEDSFKKSRGNVISQNFYTVILHAFKETEKKLVYVDPRDKIKKKEMKHCHAIGCSLQNSMKVESSPNLSAQFILLH